MKSVSNFDYTLIFIYRKEYKLRSQHLEKHYIVQYIFPVVLALFLVLFIINVLPIIYIFSFINRPINSVNRILNYGSMGVGKHL